MTKAAELFEAAFSASRDPRSKEYKEGVLDALRFRLNESDAIRCRYEAGTASADAYFAGCDEGHRLAREGLERTGTGGQGDGFPGPAMDAKK